MFDDYIQISKLNDFIFCPYSIYLHNMYENFHASIYHSTYQVEGKAVHALIDDQNYSTSKHILQGVPVYSKKFKLVGKIDTFDLKEHELVERKNLVKEIYDGYKLQLYAQYFCLIEMGYTVEKLSIYSLKNNKKHTVEIPNEAEYLRFEKLIKDINEFDLNSFKGVSQNKCNMCIYNVLCPFSNANTT